MKNVDNINWSRVVWYGHERYKTIYKLTDSVYSMNWCLIIVYDKITKIYYEVGLRVIKEIMTVSHCRKIKECDRV